MITLLTLLCACAVEEISGPLAAPEVRVEVQVAERRVEADEPVLYDIEVDMGAGWSVDPPNPQFDGLLVGLVEEERETDGDRTSVTWTYAINGEQGSYVLETQPLQFTKDGQTREVTPSVLFVDIGVNGPASDLADLAFLPQPEGHSWTPWILALLAVMILALATFFWWRARRRRRLAPPPPVPADLEALRAWTEAWAAMRADDHALALELSLIFRRYLERAVAVRALSLTQREILHALAEGAGLGADLRTRCGRLLSATDALKFARRGGGDTFFEGLDDDLRAVIAATTPHASEEARV